MAQPLDNFEERTSKQHEDQLDPKKYLFDLPLALLG